MSVRVRVKIDADRASDEFKEARRDINKRLRDGLQQAGDRVVLPSARRNAAGLRVDGRSTAASLFVRATTRDAYLTTRLNRKQGRAVGLQEFGGVVTTQIHPRRGKRAIVVNGQPVAYVKTPRHYKGRHFIMSAIEQNRHRIAVAVREELMHAFDGLDQD